MYNELLARRSVVQDSFKVSVPFGKLQLVNRATHLQAVLFVRNVTFHDKSENELACQLLTFIAICAFQYFIRLTETLK
jgi:hypothetical protein